MYTPLRFMEQIETAIKVAGARNMDEEVNRNALAFFDNCIEHGRARCLMGWEYAWNAYRHGNVTDNERDYYKSMSREFTRVTSVVAGKPEDFFHMALMALIHHDWSKAKRAYRVEKSMVNDFCTMKLPKTVPVDTLTKLPSKCFYIDMEGGCPFVQDCNGMFITWDIEDNYFLVYITAVIEHQKLIPMNTLLMCTITEDTHKLGVYASEFRENFVGKVEDGTSIRINEQMWFTFFYNFCIYLSAANSDVEYTERTRQAYKKPNVGDKPKNKIREVEEYGVGYKYSTTISTGKVKVKYVGDKPTPTEPGTKRAYSSNYRSAHWHHFWVNDPEEPGKKKLIVKWLSEVYVHGNIDDDRVTIHKVKRGEKK